MAKIIVPIDMPETCLDCPFRGASEFIAHLVGGEILYKKISRCKFAPEEIEDPWRNVQWQANNKEDWCLLEPVEEDSGFTLEPGF